MSKENPIEKFVNNFKETIQKKEINGLLLTKNCLIFEMGIISDEEEREDILDFYKEVVPEIFKIFGVLETDLTRNNTKIIINEIEKIFLGTSKYSGFLSTYIEENKLEEQHSLIFMDFFSFDSGNLRVDLSVGIRKPGSDTFEYVKNETLFNIG